MNGRERREVARALLAHAPPSFGALSRVQEAFGLTIAEVRLVGLLASGYRLEQSAKIMGCTIESVRTYSKHIYEKTNAHSQAQVVCIALRAESIGPRFSVGC